MSMNAIHNKEFIMSAPLSALIKEKGNVIYSAHPEETVFACVKKMGVAGVGALLIIDETGLVGIFTERDVSKKVVLQKVDVETVCVSSVMTRDVKTVTPSTTTDEAMSIMTEERFRHLPVLLEDNVLGLISIGDLTRWVVMSQQHNINHLVEYINNG